MSKINLCNENLNVFATLDLATPSDSLDSASTMMAETFSSETFGDIGVNIINGQLSLQGTGFHIAMSSPIVTSNINIINDETNRAIFVQSDTALFSGSTNKHAFLDITDGGHGIVLHKEAMSAAQLNDYTTTLEHKIDVLIATNVAPASNSAPEIASTVHPTELPLDNIDTIHATAPHGVGDMIFTFSEAFSAPATDPLTTMAHVAHSTTPFCPSLGIIFVGGRYLANRAVIKKTFNEPSVLDIFGQTKEILKKGLSRAKTVLQRKNNDLRL